MSKIIHASAPGKCILFGEHAVVYGYPALVLAIQLRSHCKIEKSEKGIHIFIKNYNKYLTFDSLSQMEEVIPKKFKQFYYIMSKISNEYNLIPNGLFITLESELWSGSGLGSSASIAVAMIIALNSFWNLNLTREKINSYAYFMEEYVHRTPSGIDNTICNYGGAIVFQKGEWKRLPIPNMPILIIYSGQSHNTGKITESLRNKTNFTHNSYLRIEELVNEGILALKKNDLIHLGELCYENQKILTELGLSTTKIDEIIDISKKNGAYGSKLTGAGAGGSVITLGKLNILQKIQDILEKKNYQTKICNLDYKGGKLDSKQTVYNLKNR